VESHPLPQRVNETFGVTIAARDEFGRIVTNFAGPVELTGWIGAARQDVEDFESGTWPHAPWIGNSLGLVSSDYAHDGAFGLNMTNEIWAYRTDVQLGESGSSLSWWVRPASSAAGRAYLGFAASAAGCWSVVAAPNTDEFALQENVGYDYNDVVTVSQTWQAGRWYRVAVEFGEAAAVTGKLYDSDGTTLLNTLTYSNVPGLPGGVAIRSFSDFAVDTVASEAGAPIAIAPTNTGGFVGGVWTGSVAVLQPATNALLVAGDTADTAEQASV